MKTIMRLLFLGTGILLLFVPVDCYSTSLPPERIKTQALFDLRQGKKNCKVLLLKGVEFHLAPEFLKRLPTAKRQPYIARINRVLEATKRVMPNTFHEFVKRKYKVFLLYEPLAPNGLEFVRVGQEKWDRRIPRDGQMTKSIIIFNSLDFLPPFDTFYFVHEMAHFNHLAINPHRDKEIKQHYSSVVGRAGKFKGMYAGKNYLEYFAESSATYLLPRQLIPRPAGFPKGPMELKSYSPSTYRMCESFWFSKKPKIIPNRNLALKVDDIQTQPRIPINREKLNEMLFEIETAIKWGDHYEMINRTNSLYEQEAFEAYFRAHGRIIRFQRKFPDHDISQFKIKVCEKIGLDN